MLALYFYICKCIYSGIGIDYEACTYLVGQRGGPRKEMGVGLYWPAQFQGPFSQFWAWLRFGFHGSELETLEDL